MITKIETVDTAFYNKLVGMATTDDEGNAQSIPVVYIDPEPEFKAEAYPSIVFYRMGIYPNTEKYINDVFYDNYTFDSSGNPLTVQKRNAPEPFIVYYGVRLYYQYQRDGLIMTDGLLARFRRGSYLDIDGDKYDASMVSYRNPNSSYRQFGEIKKDEPREFIDQYLYRVDIELDNAVRETLKLNQYGVTIRTSIIK
jgi:hypothetical protein